MQKVSILPLGAGCQVGRSCLILNVNGKKIMLDCGLMINKGGRDALPLFQKLKAQQLSLILITHAHLDHCGALPYFLSNFNYKKKIYMTKPTKDIYHYLVRDTLKVRNQQALFTQQQIRDSMQQISTIDFGIQIQQQNIKITAYVAGHIVGAAMFIIQIDGVKILYTGDYSCQEDRYIMKAEIPQSNVDILIAQSTFGIRLHQNRAIREQMFQQEVRKIVKAGGKCLLPVFSAGRAEELLFILDQYWEKKKDQLANIHIYYTVSLINTCKDIYQTYIDMLSEKIKQRFYKQINNPFKYKYIQYLKTNQRIFQQENNPMVVMCTPGMLQSGQSRTLLERWCHDPRNGVIITGYCAQGSIANNLKKGDLIKSMQGDRPITVNLNVSEISFAAHADCQQTTQFIKKVKPAHVVLVHGSQKNAQLLRDYLLKTFQQIQTVSCPQNQEQLPFQISITQKYQIAGTLKDKIQQMAMRRHSQKVIRLDSQVNNSNKMIDEKQQIQIAQNNIEKKKQTYQFNGYIVQSGEQKFLVQQNDKNILFPYLKGIDIKQKIIVNYLGSLTLAELLAQKIFRNVKRIIKNGQQKLLIKQDIQMSILEQGSKALIQFISSKKNEIIADQFCYLLENIIYDPLIPEILNEFNPVPAKQKQIFEIIKSQYPFSILSQGIMIVKKKQNDILATANLFSKNVDCKDQYLKMRIQGLIQNFVQSYQKENFI